ncbi:MAG: UvrD-helicase domain-containing protein [Candidatus Dojkabacteria bacterium]|nr:MAG: UvrD-helicase domain-containing protein [Candidatus Dojkabacteria bacterium]
MGTLEGLNAAQRAAVEACDGPLLILAGAGSGKTRVLTMKIAHLITELQYRPDSILAVTFTKKAANEMQERIAQLLPPEMQDRKPFVGTFHSFGAYLLRRHAQEIGLDRSFTIYDQDDQLSVVKAICKDLEISQNFKPNLIHDKISDAKNKGIAASEYFENSYGDDFDEIVSKVYKEYVRRLQAQNAVDFDDLLSLVVKLFDTKPEILARYQQQFHYVLVDEYQDTNMEQYRIVRALAKVHRHLCVVGDEDQSIYSWRGATIDNIRFFQKDFQEHKIVKLEQNYRSTKVILEAANHVISKNPNRIPKALWTEKSQEFPIIINRLDDPFSEAMQVLRELQKYQSNLDEVAVLYRVNSLSRSFEEVFVKFGVPYKLVGGVGFYHRMEVKDVLAYIKFVSNPKDEVSLLRIINTPSRKIGDGAIKNFREVARASRLTFAEFVWYGALVSHDPEFSRAMVSDDFLLKIQEAGNTVFTKFPQLFEQLGQAIKSSFDPEIDISSYIMKVVDSVGYKSWIEKMASTKEEIISRTANVQELAAVAERNKYVGREGLMKFLEDVALVEEAKEVADDVHGPVHGKVHLMSIHAAKGLEFGTVFLVGLEEGIFPHNRSLENPVQMQEERRLFYVAITRAKEHLYLSSSRKRQLGSMMFETVPSQYITDIPDKLKIAMS